MSKIEVNTVAPQCGTTLTLGESGDTVTLGTGASQTGFGRTGTVDWQTGSIKTATFTAVNGEGYFANTSGGAFTMNLPAGSAGAIVSVVDYTNTFQTNALTVSPNGSEKIGGVAADANLTTEGQSVTFVYVDATEGWKNVQDSTSNIVANQFFTATVSGTGNTLTTAPCCSDVKIAKFIGPGTFNVVSLSQTAPENVVSYMVVAGGGGGASRASGGGGGGGYREGKSPVTPYTASPLNAPTGLTMTAGSFPITVGAGGAGGSPPSGENPGVQGGTSTFSTITSAGGGMGNGSAAPSQPAAQAAGGSGGGAGPGGDNGGAGNTPPVSPPQGNPGGSGSGVNYNGGGGGGAGGAGESPKTPGGGDGGAVTTSSISATPTSYAGGGGGSSYFVSNPGPGGAGTPTSGAGGPSSGSPGGNGVVNTGGAGGAGATGNPNPANPGCGGAGGSGIVIIRYKFQ
jgi:hypothetical protein